MNLTRIFLFFLFPIFYSCKKEPIQNVPALKKQENVNAKYYLDSIYKSTLNSTNDSLNREELFKIASEYENRMFYRESKHTLDWIFKKAQEMHDTLHQAKVYWYLGNIYDDQQKLDTAFLYYTKAEKLYSLTKKDSLNWVRMISYKAGILYDIGIPTESEAQTVRALTILTQLKDTRLIYEANLGMALNLKELKEYDEALKYYNKIPDLLNQLEKEEYDTNKLKRSWLSYYNNMGSFYNDMKAYPKAKSYLEKALSLDYIDDFPKLHAMLLNNYARNRISSSNNTQIIDSLLNTSLKIRKQIDHKQGIIGSKITMGEYLSIKGDTLNAIKNIKEAYLLAVKEKSHYDILRSLELLSLNDKENQNLYIQKHLKTKDSLYELDKAIRNKFARIEYETNEIEEKNTFLTKRNLYLAATLVVLSFLSILIIMIIRLKSRNKTLLHQRNDQKRIQEIQELLIDQQTISEETKALERDRIGKDLHDGILNRLFTTRINLERLDTLTPLTKKQLLEELQKTESQIRAIAHDLHVSFFNQQQDFSLVLEDLVISQKNTFNTKFNFSILKKIDWSYFKTKQKTTIYLIIQELLQNVNKHSKAQNCFVFILQKEQDLIIRVHDDGVGFKNKLERTGLGLSSLKDRLVRLNAVMDIKSKTGTTVISVQIPIV